MAELALDAQLVPLIAANPATPAQLLEQLSLSETYAIRRVIAANPNISPALLLLMTRGFPREVLANPIVHLLNLSQPDFFKELSVEAWLRVLSCEQIPHHALQLAKQTASLKGRGWQAPLSVHTVNMHVLLRGEVQNNASVVKEIQSELENYNLYVKKAYPSNHLHETLFFLHALPLPLRLRSIEVMKKANNEEWAASYGLKTIDNKALTLLAKSSTPEADILRKLMARQQSSNSIEALEKLASDKAPEARRKAARNLQVPQSILWQLANDRNASVCQAVAANIRTDKELLSRLALHQDVTVRVAVAKRFALDEKVYQRLAVDVDRMVRVAIARNRDVSQELLQKLAADPDEKVRAAVAGNTRIPADLYGHFSQDKSNWVREQLAGNTQTPHHIFEILAKDVSDVRCRLAANPRLPEELFLQLAHEKKVPVLAGVAANPQASPELLTRLAQMGQREICVRIAANKRTPPEVLKRLVVYEDHFWNTPTVWERLASNPHTPLETLKRIFLEGNELLKDRVVHHPTVRRERTIYQELFIESIKHERLNSTSLKWRFHLLQIPDVPRPLLSALAQSMYWQERYMVAQHMATPRHTLVALTHDGNCYVRMAARDALVKHL